MIKITRDEFNGIVTNADNRCINKYLADREWFVYEFSDRTTLSVCRNMIVVETSFSTMHLSAE